MNAVLHATDSSGSTVETLYQMSLDMGLDGALVMLSYRTQCWPECHLPFENDSLDIRVAHHLPQLVRASVCI